MGEKGVTFLLPCLHLKKFICFAKKSVIKLHQNSKILSRTFGGLLFFVRQQKSLFLNGILRWVMLFGEHVPLICDIFSYTKTFACLRCEQGYKNKKFVGTEFSISLQMPDSIFWAISANRAFAKKFFVLFRFLSHFIVFLTIEVNLHSKGVWYWTNHLQFNHVSKLGAGRGLFGHIYNTI